MEARVLLPMLVALSCAAPAARDGGRSETLPACCAARDQIDALDGQRVILIGTYVPRFVTRKPGEPERLAARGIRPRTVAIETAGGAAVMLGVYHGAGGLRAADEIARLACRRVRVVGVLHAHTPTQRSPEGIPMQTMIGPYLGEIEGIEPLAP